MVTVYSSPHCQPCRATKRTLASLGIPFVEVDAHADADAAAWLREEGFQRTPVVRAETASGVLAWDGHRPERIASLAEVLA